MQLSRGVRLILFASIVSPTHAVIPQSTCVQGYLEDLLGTPVDASVTFEVCIFDALTGGNQVWPSPPTPCQTMPNVIVSAGLFSICFGDGDLTPTIFGPTGFGPQPRWLEVRTFGEAMSPRIELHSAPYAFRTGFVDNPELTDHVELGTGAPATQGSLRVFDNGGNNEFVVLPDHRVGIGRGPGTPDFSLQTGRGLMVHGDELNLVGSETQGNSGISSIIFHNTNSSEAKKRVASIYAMVAGLSGAHLDFNTEDGTFANSPARMRITSDGNVGIGTTNPGARLEVASDLGASMGNPNGLLIRNTSTSSNDGNAIQVVDDQSAMTRWKVDAGGNQFGFSAEGWTVYIPNGGPSHVFFTGSGNFGIGTANPSEKLTVCGNIRASGNITANAGCDVAETFELSERAKIEPGMVMVLDEKSPGQLRISTTSYDTKVAGIVSGAKGLNPGVKLGQRADGSDDLPVALSGRVYCNVDASGFGVAVGDLLTTSDTPGYAMKVTNFARSQGAVLGKAMEPLEKGNKGLILVLVGLQ